MNYEEAANYCIKYLEGSLCVFAGAGLSMGTGLPSWSGLVKPLADELGISESQLPLPRILQYAYGENKARYSSFVHQFRKEIQKAKPLTAHHLITRLDVNRIWTTNYDDLIEKAFHANGIPVEVITNDHQLSNAELLQKQVIKMHGSLSSITDDYDSIVLTEGQYENCEIGRTAVYNLLRNDIANKSFLFLGVSFDDMNMRKIWASVWYNKKAGKPSFLFTVPPKNDETEKLKLFELWEKDLARYGIVVIKLDDYSQISDFLRLLCIKKHGRTIAAIATYPDHTYEKVCREFGRQLAAENYYYHSGGGRNISVSVAEGIWDQCDIRNNLDRVTFFYREKGGSTNVTKGKVIYAGETHTEMRNILFSAEKLCVVLGESEKGRSGMTEEKKIAREKGCVLLGIPTIGKIGRETYEEEKAYWRRKLGDDRYKNLYEKLDVDENEFKEHLDDGNYISDYVKRIMDIIDQYFNAGDGSK
ncbi:MAG: SIR2 family protein [Lachnospiraceae bacterium]